MTNIVLPKWVTQIAVIALGITGLLEILGATLNWASLPDPIALAVTVISGIAAGIGRALGDDDQDGTPNFLDPDYSSRPANRKGGAEVKLLAVVVVAAGALLTLLACTSQLSATMTMRFGPTDVEYGCTASPPNNRCIVVIRDSIAPGNTPILITDTVPIGVTRTVAITRTLTPGQRVVVLGSFEGLTATGRKAGAVAARAETVYDPAASQAVPFLRFAPPS